ncbi:ABC transporter substrate-binding protein [Halobellus ordinarius]|uniref:ABC transporter substrate-binding protein n=1 Tax=Halobellus ordinarius TaxID=3075120 RepID=UPI002880435B|nr:ABC transporter substrate-binding protein [Halobellus sp. ZY16]
MTENTNSRRSRDGQSVNRRTVLQGGAVATAALLAGCGGGGGGGGVEGEPVGTQQIRVGELSNFVDLAGETANQWSELGVDFELDTTTWGTFVGEAYTNTPEDVSHTPWGSSPDRVDPDFHLSTYTSDSAVNISGYENEEYDDLFDQQRAAYDPDERAEIIGQMQEILREDLPEIVYVWPKATLPINTGQFDIQPTEFIGARTTGTMTVLTAEPVGDTNTLIVGAQQEIAVPNPLAPSSNDLQYLLKLAYDTPSRVGLDGDPINWAVENYDQVDDTTIDMTLREGMTFHDGESLTAEDLEFTFEFLNEYSFPKYDPFLSDVEGAEMQTDLTVRVDLAQPNVAFLNSAMTFMNILPMHIWEDVPDEVEQPVNWNADVDQLVGSGPLEITEITDTEIRYEAFDDHWETPAFDEFVFVNRASMEAIRADFEEQNIHMTTSSPPPSVTNNLADENDYISKSSAASVLQMKMSFNLGQQPFSDPAFREALMLATDPDRIIDVFYNGEADVGDGTLVHPQSSFSADLQPVERDLEAAKQTLRDAGYEYDDDGQLHYPAE